MRGTRTSPWEWSRFSGGNRRSWTAGWWEGCRNRHFWKPFTTTRNGAAIGRVIRCCSVLRASWKSRCTESIRIRVMTCAALAGEIKERHATLPGIIERDPSRTLVIFFGESHLASKHLPGRLRSILNQRGISREELLILQNLDEIYWKLQKRGLENVRSVRLQERQYCVFNATPIEKYESFRQYLHKCVDEDDTGVWTHFVHSLIDLTMEFVDLKRDGAMLDSLPKVYSEISSAQLPQILARLSVPANRARMALDHFQENGTSYVPELNSIFIHHLQLTAAAEESTRFIHQLCRGDLPNRLDRPAEDQFFVSVIERALGYFCSKVLDSSRDGIESLSQRVLSQIGYNEQLARAVSSLMKTARRPAAQHFETLKLAIASENRASRTTQMLAQLLGYVLGRKLYGAFLETRVSRRDIQALFCDPLNTPNRPLECYREWTERLS